MHACVILLASWWFIRFLIGKLQEFLAACMRMRGAWVTAARMLQNNSHHDASASKRKNWIGKLATHSISGWQVACRCTDMCTACRMQSWQSVRTCSSQGTFATCQSEVQPATNLPINFLLFEAGTHVRLHTNSEALK